MNLLNDKEKFLGGCVYKAQNNLKEINKKIEEAQREDSVWQYKLNTSYNLGVISRDQLYNNLRMQGKIIYHQQMVRSKLLQLQEEFNAVSKSLTQYQYALKKTKIKHKKISLLLQKYKTETNIKNNICDEIESHEVMNYGR